MKALRCDVCGGKLIMDSTRKFSSCESCGLEYTVDTMRMMLKTLGSIELNINGVATEEALIKRARLSCADGEFNKASDLIEQALSINPENAEGYLVALMSECKCDTEEQLGQLALDTLEQNKNYQKVVRFGDTSLKYRVEHYKDQVERNFQDKQLRETEQRSAAKKLEKLLNGGIVVDETLKKELEKTQAAISKLNSKLDGLKASINSLDNYEKQIVLQLDSLGIFSGRKKRELDEELLKIKAQRNETERQIDKTINSKKALSKKRRSQPKIPSLRWKIISIDYDNNRALAITEEIVAEKRFDSSPSGWKNSEIRAWLNSDFYNSLSHIVKSRTQSTKVADLEIADKVFLLSIDEAEEYFSSEKERITGYKGTKTAWWLRSPGALGTTHVALIDLGGDLNFYGTRVDSEEIGVRPALWLNLDS